MKLRGNAAPNTPQRGIGFFAPLGRIDIPAPHFVGDANSEGDAHG